MSKKKKIFTIDDAIKVIITPWDKGFSCGILFGKNAKEFSANFYWDKVVKKYLK